MLAHLVTCMTHLVSERVKYGCWRPSLNLPVMRLQPSSCVSVSLARVVTRLPPLTSTTFSLLPLHQHLFNCQKVKAAGLAQLSYGYSRT